MAAADRFRAMLQDSIRQIYKGGLDRRIEFRAMPALAELAEAIASTPNTGDRNYYGEVIEALLHRAIGRIGDEPRTSKGKRPLRGTTAQERRDCLTLLLGIGNYPGGDQNRRLSEAADALGFANGRSLRQSKRGDRYLVDLLLDDLLDQLVEIGDEAAFLYSGLQSWSKSYPERPVYDYNRLSWDYGRYGATDRRPVFNSFINTPSYGDETLFLDGRRGDEPKNTNYDPVRDVTAATRLVVLRMYVHNMAFVFRDDPYSSTAVGTRVRIALPTDSAQVLRARGYIWADNADMVEDTVDLIGNEPFRLAYVPGSAELFRHDIYRYGLDDSIVEPTGAPIGHSVMDGVFPAGNLFEYAALVEITVRIIVD